MTVAAYQPQVQLNFIIWSYGHMVSLVRLRQENYLVRLRKHDGFMFKKTTLCIQLQSCDVGDVTLPLQVKITQLNTNR